MYVYMYLNDELQQGGKKLQFTGLKRGNRKVWCWTYMYTVISCKLWTSNHHFTFNNKITKYSSHVMNTCKKFVGLSFDTEY